MTSVEAEIGNHVIVAFAGDVGATSVEIANAGSGGGSLALTNHAQATNSANVVTQIWSGRVRTAVSGAYGRQTASYGGVINALYGDATHIYVAGGTTLTVRKYLKSDLSYIGETASYGGTINALSGDATHVYAAGATIQTARKYLKSDPSYIGETANERRSLP